MAAGAGGRLPGGQDPAELWPDTDRAHRIVKQHLAEEALGLGRYVPRVDQTVRTARNRDVRVGGWDLQLVDPADFLVDQPPQLSGTDAAPGSTGTIRLVRSSRVCRPAGRQTERDQAHAGAAHRPPVSEHRDFLLDLAGGGLQRLHAPRRSTHLAARETERLSGTSRRWPVSPRGFCHSRPGGDAAPRTAAGVSPRRALSTRVMCCWLAKPQAAATSARPQRPCRSMAVACSTRRDRTY